MGGVSLPLRAPHPASLPLKPQTVAIFAPSMHSDRVDHARILRASFAFAQERDAQGSGADPWQLHPMAALALGTYSATPWLRTVAVRGPVPAIVSQQTAVARVAYYAPVVAKRRRLQQRLLDTVGDDWRAVALHKWLAVVECNLHASEVGRHLLRLHNCPDALVTIKGILDDVTASKATATLSLRVNALLAYWKWFKTIGDTGVLPFPVLELSMYAYFRILDKDGKSASKASSFLQSWRFAVFVFGFEDPTLAATSLRCAGSAHKQFLRKRMLRSRNTLHTIAMACLEIAACHLEDSFLSAAAGFLCLCLYGRLRCSDGNKLSFVAVEETVVGSHVTKGFLEAAMTKSKTSKSKEKMTMFLPVVVPMIGLTGNNWYRAFESSRRALNLADIPGSREEAEGSEEVCVFPSWRSWLAKSPKPVDAEELSLLLTWILQKCLVPDRMLANIGSHSLKATLLTACGKYPLETEDRQLLGYHVLRREASVLNYNRDNLAGPIEKLWTVLKSIRAGRFLPDAVRSERHRKARLAVPLASQFLQVMGFSPEDLEGKLSGFALDESGVIADVVTPVLAAGPEEDVEFGELDQIHSPTSLVEEEEDQEGLVSGNDDVSSSDWSEDVQPPLALAPILDEHEAARLAAEVSGESSLVAVRKIRMKVIPEAANTNELYRHSVRLTVHYGSFKGSEFLGCGRAKLMLHKQTFDDVTDLFPLCRDCFALE